MGIEDRGQTDYEKHPKSAKRKKAGTPNDASIPPSDSSPSTGGTVKRIRGGRVISITIGKQSAFTEVGELTTVPVVPDAQGKPRLLQPRELQLHLASQGLSDPKVNEQAVRQRLAIARNQDRRRQKSPK